METGDRFRSFRITSSLLSGNYQAIHRFLNVSSPVVYKTVLFSAVASCVSTHGYHVDFPHTCEIADLFDRGNLFSTRLTTFPPPLIEKHPQSFARGSLEIEFDGSLGLFSKGFRPSFATNIREESYLF